MSRSRRSRLTLRDLVEEALSGVSSRPARLVLTTLGTVLGIAALVATVGVGQTASGQIGERFDLASATRIVVEPVNAAGPGRSGAATRLRWDASDRIDRLAGVAAAGTVTEINIRGVLTRGSPVTAPGESEGQAIPLSGASPGLFDAVRAELRTGRYFDRGHDRRADPVALLGRYAAERLGINRVDSQPAIFVGDRAFIVIGIVDGVAARASLLDSVIVPAGVARKVFGAEAPSVVEVRTDVGATQLIGRQAPVAIEPNAPELLDVEVPPRPGGLRDAVSGDVDVLFLALGGVALLVGGLGIANVTLLSVMERVGEIGLRRAVGATRPHIARQFLLESVVVGLLGGLIGASAGVLVTVGVSAVRNWTPLLDVRLAAFAPLLGAAIGLVAGTYPAWRASAIEPIAALRGE